MRFEESDPISHREHLEHVCMQQWRTGLDMVGEASFGFSTPFQATDTLKKALALPSHISAGSGALNGFTSSPSIT